MKGKSATWKEHEVKWIQDEIKRKGTWKLKGTWKDRMTLIDFRPRMLATSEALGIWNITVKYLLEMLSPIILWCEELGYWICSAPDIHRKTLLQHPSHLAKNFWNYLNSEDLFDKDWRTKVNLHENLKRELQSYFWFIESSFLLAHPPPPTHTHTSLIPAFSPWNSIISLKHHIYQYTQHLKMPKNVSTKRSVPASHVKGLPSHSRLQWTKWTVGWRINDGKRPWWIWTFPSTESPPAKKTIQVKQWQDDLGTFKKH